MNFWLSWQCSYVARDGPQNKRYTRLFFRGGEVSYATKSASKRGHVWCSTFLFSVLCCIYPTLKLKYYGWCMDSLANFEPNSLTCIAIIRACGKLEAKNILIELKGTLLTNIWQEIWKKLIPTPTKKNLSRKYIP